MSEHYLEIGTIKASWKSNGYLISEMFDNLEDAKLVHKNTQGVVFMELVSMTDNGYGWKLVKDTNGIITNIGLAILKSKIGQIVIAGLILRFITMKK